MQGLPLFLLLGWTTKAFTPDLRSKAGLTARDLDLRLEIVSSGAALWKQLLLPVFTIACIIFIMRSRNLLRAYMSVLLPIMLFGAFLVLSYFWSDAPSDTLRRGVRQIFLFTAVAGAVVIGRSQNRFVSYLQFFSVFLLIYEAMFLLVPWISFDVFNKFTGLHQSKNEFGGIAGAFVLLSACIYRYYAETQRERRNALICGVGWAVLLVLSGSKTPMGFLVLLIPLLFYSQHLVRYVSITVIAFWLLIIVFIPSGFVDLCMELGVIPTVIWLVIFWVFLVVTRNASDPISTSLIAYGMLHNCLETSFVHGLHFVWVIMLIAMMNILYTQARKPNLEANFRAIREAKRNPEPQPGG